MDGSALTNLAGFRVYYGSSPTSLSASVTISNPATVKYVVSGLTSGTYYFGVTAYDANGIESDLSSIASKKI
jgi:fibronectin type 3 domain-containing protein